MTDARLDFPATRRNRDAILEVLRRVLPAQGRVLEIGSGSGQHVVHFAADLPHLRFVPSDLEPEHRDSIAAWTAHLGLDNVEPPLAIDASAGPGVRERVADWGVDRVDAVYCANVIHIAPWEVCLGLMAGAAARVGEGAPVILYGPFKRDGQHTAPSNEAFDHSLRGRDPRWGVRDLAQVSDVARGHGLELDEVVEMPANNLTVVWRRRTTPGD